MSRVILGPNATVDDGATVGYEYDREAGPALIGGNARIRSGTIIYADVDIGRAFVTGHDALVREHTTVGEEVLVGTKAVVDGATTIGSNVSIQTGAYVPQETEIGDRVFLGPKAVLTNDPYPLRMDTDLQGPTIEDDVSIGANATVLPDVTVGTGAFVAAGAVVDQDVPPETLAVGVPAQHRPLPDELRERNVVQ